MRKNEIQPTHSKYLDDYNIKEIPRIVDSRPISNKVNKRLSTFETYDINKAKINDFSRLKHTSSNSIYKSENVSVFNSKLPIDFDEYMNNYSRSKSINNQSSKVSKNLNKKKEETKIEIKEVEKKEGSTKEIKGDKIEKSFLNEPLDRIPTAVLKERLARYLEPKM